MMQHRGQRYILGEQIGEGAFGSVWRATQTRSEGDGAWSRTCAVKVVATPECAEREARNIQRLPAGCGIPLLDDFAWGSAGVVVMGFAPGGTLRALLAQQGPLPFKEGLVIARHLAFTLSRVHRAGMVHLDVKPGNVVFGAAGTAYLCDWGGASDLGRDAGVRGTPHYMAPERIPGGPGVPEDGWRVDQLLKLADAYSLGVLLAELFTGERPRPEWSASERMGRLLQAFHAARLSGRAIHLLLPVVLRLTSPDPAGRIGVSAAAWRLRRTTRS